MAVADLQRACDFYAGTLQFRLHARWTRGAYLSCGDLWLCLSLGPVYDAADYSHVAFSVDAEAMDHWRRRLDAAAVPRWQENVSEGDSIYFLDPDGHRCELHAGDLVSRLAALRQSPYEGLELFD